MGNTNSLNSFSLLLISLFFFISSTSSLQTFSISETLNQTLVCALVQSSNSTQSTLNCSSFPAGIQIPVNPNASVSAIVAGDGFMCALRFESVINCWRFSINGTGMSTRRIYRGPILTQLESGNSHICGVINGTNSLQCWQWPEFTTTSPQRFLSIAVGDEFVCGLSETGAISCLGNTNFISNSPTGNYNVIAAGFRHACAIDFDNNLVCWGDMMGTAPQGKFTALALGENRSCALRINETVVCWGQNNFGLPDSLTESNFITIEAKRSVFCGIIKSNFSLFCWGNEIFDSNLMVFSDVVPGTCRIDSDCPCGPLAGSGRFCGGGRSICQSACIQNPPPPPAPAPPLPPPPPPPQRSGGNEWNGRMIAFLVVGCVGSSSLLLVIGFFLFRYFKGRGCSRVHDSGRLDEIEAAAPPENAQQPPPRPLPPVLEKRLSQMTSMGTGSHLEEFSLEILLQATNNFSEENKIGTGSFGSVYHATLDDGRDVAIKRAEMSTTSSHVGSTRRREDKDVAFVNELESLSRLHHKNLVRLLGFCEELDELVLVYEYMSNGTLHDHLHKLQESPLMSWVERIKVALDAARGIHYLHDYAVPPIIHRDIKSSNILLDAKWTAKVSDFGLSLMGPEGESHLSLRAAGTVGYIDPEYYRLQQLTTKSDVYSFGVLLLEILSGYRAIHQNGNGNPRNVVDFMVPFIVQDDIHRVLDRRVPPPTPFEIEAVAFVGYLAADCVNLEGRDRPSMMEIVNSLERALRACLMHPSLSRSTTDQESVHSL